MKVRVNVFLYLFFLIWAALSVPRAQAIPLSVGNHSFEDFSLADGFFSRPLGSSSGPRTILSADPIPSWSVTGQAGSWNNTLAQLPSDTTDGENTVWLHNSAISQALASVVEMNSEYELSVDVGFTVGGGSPGYRLQLLAGTTIVAEDNNSLSLPFGDLVTSTIRFTALASDPLLGQQLSISIQSFGIETIFDNVRLNANPTSNPVPEPSTMILLSTGLIGLVGFNYKRNKKVT